MSWKDAQKDAKRWVDSLNLPSNTKGFLDLTEQGKTIRHAPEYRTMVVRAARRILRKRGIECHLPES